MKRTDFERCPIHGARLKGVPGAYWCPFDGGHTPRLPDLGIDLTDVTDWPAICDGCGLQRSQAAIGDWLCSDAHLDFHMCPRCERRIGRQLLREVEGPALPRFLALMRPRRPQIGS